MINHEDFWSRKSNTQSHKVEFAIMGDVATITANQVEVLNAAHLSRERYSRSISHPGNNPINIKIVVRQEPAPPVPADLPQRLIYAGVGAWLTVSAGEWGHGFAGLSRREAVLVLSPQLAADTRLVSRYFLDHYLLNLILAEWAMLHASCVVSPDNEQLIILVAPHNTGKSTTALRLLRAGYKFLADGMALLQQTGQGFEVGGYPIGEVKLRDDVLALFPDYSGQRVLVREQRKTVVNLRQIHPGLLVKEIIRPTSILLCFLERGNTGQASVKKLLPEETLPLLAGNTVFWDEPERLAANNNTLHSLVRVARCYQLKTGDDFEELLAAIDQLAGR